MTHVEATRARREKANAMASMYLAGMSQKAIAQSYGISRQRVQQLLRDIGVVG